MREQWRTYTKFSPTPPAFRLISSICVQGVHTSVWGLGSRSQLGNNYLAEMCSGSEAGSYLRLIDFVYHSTLGLRVIKKKKKSRRAPAGTGLWKRLPARGFGRSSGNYGGEGCLCGAS